MFGTTKKCPVCGAAYKVMPHYAGDQSACRQCVRAAERDQLARQDERRRRAFPNAPWTRRVYGDA